MFKKSKDEENEEQTKSNDESEGERHTADYGGPDKKESDEEEDENEDKWTGKHSMGTDPPPMETE